MKFEIVFPVIVISVAMILGVTFGYSFGTFKIRGEALKTGNASWVLNTNEMTNPKPVFIWRGQTNEFKW
jgi:hypothetical protein